VTDEQKLTFLLKELKILARETHCYDDNSGGRTFEDGEKYSLVSFARSILESMDESYEQ
jgi:hypothetical protein